MMINVVVGGATGRLGSLVCEGVTASGDMRLTGAVVSRDGGNVGRELYPGVVACGPDGLDRALEGCDVYVDLTSPAAASAVIPLVPDTGANIVLGTTAVDNGALDAMAAAVERCGTSALVSANFAIGVNVFWKVCELMAAFLPDYDIEVVEAHHNRKRDAPSGTALEAVRRLESATGIDDVRYGRQGVTGPRGREICVHSIRAGDIVGTHTVLFGKNDELLELSHKAISRQALANGCLEAIRWMAGRRDGKIHNMDEVLGL